MQLLDYITFFILSCFTTKGIFSCYRSFTCQFRKSEEDREKVCNGMDCIACELCPYYIEN